ncbi:MAG: hypothetical protein H5U07_04380 [Candidatus Aminicenantes bacterium]|nr:hypothetical protein [Candidatus Aminicenantes bacterium]
MIATSTAITVVTVLLAICVIWLVYIIIRGHTESLLRTIIFIIILGIILGYLKNTQLERLSFKAIKNDLFPPSLPQYSYVVQEQDTQYSHRIVYRFIIKTEEDTPNLPPPPELKLDMDPNGRTFTLRDIESLNLVLDQLNLPPVSHGVQELYTLTGNQTDIGIYRWDDYPLGTLIVERTIFQHRDSLQSYHAIASITVDRRKY